MNGGLPLFTTTHWSVVLQAGAEFSPLARGAVESLCKAYWYPLYVRVRRLGWGPEDAQDLTQQFLARFIERKYLKVADPLRGRFRSFLLTSLNHFVINEWQKGQAAKRGGQCEFLSFDEQLPETRYLAEPVDGLSPDKLYDKRWAVALLERVLARLRGEYAAAGKGPLFDSLKSQALGEFDAEGYSAIAGRLDMSEGALRIAVHRMRERYRALLRDEVAMTVADVGDIAQELRHLIAALRD